MNDKREAFNRLFPKRVEKLIDALRVVEHCSKPHMERNQDLTKRCWIEIAKRFEEVAAEFEIDWTVTLDGKSIYDYDTSKPLEESLPILQPYYATNQ